MNTRQLQYAVLLSKTLNFSQVAEQLGISQPSLSKQILALENELGVKLFDRNHSPMSLTPAGEYFITNAQELLYRQDQLIESLNKYKSGETGQVTVGVTPFRSQYLMPEIIVSFRERYPNVKVILREVSSNQLKKEALEGLCDFAIVNLPIDTSALDVIPLEPDTLVLAVPNNLTDKLPVVKDNVLTPEDLAKADNLPFVTLGQGQELRQLFDNICLSADLYPVIAAEVVGVTTAWAMAKSGVGATLLPLQFVKNQFFDENLTLFTIKHSLYSRQPAIVRRKGQYLSDYAEYAIELLKN